jgi:Flp pilus assembly protein TadG
MTGSPRKWWQKVHAADCVTRSARSLFAPATTPPRSQTSLLRDDDAQVVVLVALAMVIIVSFVGFAIDVGQMRYAKRQLQNAADAAALAGATELNYCGGTANCTALQTAAQNAITENGYGSSTLATNCGTPGSGLSITVNNGPCALGSKTADPHYGDTNYVEVVVTQPQPTYFARVLGLNSVSISARAEAALAGGTNCMYALDPSGSNAITVDVLAAINSQCGIVDESSSSSALTCNLLAYIGASQIGVVGGYSGFLCLGISPSPKTHIARPSPADPLAYLPKPSVPACGTNLNTSGAIHGSPSALNITGTATLYPDYAYCGGINIGLGANVTFMPGTYVLTSTNSGSNRLPGGLQINLLSAVNGTGVTFYNYGPSGGVTFLFSSLTLGGVSLVAPTSGTYSGILFFQDPGNSSQATIIGSSSWNTRLEGTYYFPSAKVVFALDGLENYNILDAYDIEFAALTYGTTKLQSNFNNDYSSLANGSPVKGRGAVLIE